MFVAGHVIWTLKSCKLGRDVLLWFVEFNIESFEKNSWVKPGQVKRDGIPGYYHATKDLVM